MKTGIIRRVGSGSDPHDTAGICARKARLNVVLVAEFWNGGVDDTRSEFSSAQTITMRHALDKGTLEIQILLSIHS